MDILGVGFPELVFIFIIALMVFGPRRLPEIAAKVGKTVRDLRNMSQGLLAEWQREITVAARLEELEAARQEIQEVKQELLQARRTVAAQASAEMKEARKEIETVKEEVEQTKAMVTAGISPEAEVKEVKKVEQTELLTELEAEATSPAEVVESQPESSEAAVAPDGASPSAQPQAEEATEQAPHPPETTAVPETSPEIKEAPPEIPETEPEIQQAKTNVTPQTASK